MSDEQKKPCIDVSFDVNQMSNQLLWNVDDENANPTTGRYAGGIRFFHGDVLDLNITASGDAIAFPDFTVEVVDCCFVTQPQIVGFGVDGVEYAPPSIFAGVEQATFLVQGPFQEAVQPPDLKGVRRVFLRKPQAVTIGRQNGRWELSLYLTVTITFPNQDKQIKRVFIFDPESEVGNGTH